MRRNVAAAVMVDPIEELAHDHRELNGLLLAVQEALDRVAREPSKLEDELHEIRDGIEALRDELLDHFAREQEGLLPFVTRRLPKFESRADTLIVEHDRISAAVTALVAQLDGVVTVEALGTWCTTFASFQGLYTEHTQSELAFLNEVASLLANDPEAAEQLRHLLNET